MKQSVTKAEIPMGTVVGILAETYPTHPMSEVTGCEPYKVLVACLMSLRTRDDTTMPLAEKLFKVADTPEKMVKLSLADLQQRIFPVGFYKTKAQTILDFSQRIIDEFDGRVPDEIDVLMTFKGVGRKTANLVVGLGYQKPAICVDIHVHRICNRMGYIDTKTPEDTEWALRDKLDPQLWHTVNRVMVRHGQDCCKPIGPMCDVCPVAQYCAKIDVKPRKKPA